MSTTGREEHGGGVAAPLQHPASDQPEPPGSGTAVVLGAGMAGLLAAAVLSEGFEQVVVSRPLVEAITHRRVAALPGVRFLARHEVLGLVTTADRRTVTGVRGRPRDGGAPSPDSTTGGGPGGDASGGLRVDADLVVDATGRGAGTAAWLAEIGAQRPEATTVRSDLVYVTRHHRLREDVMGAPLGTVVAPHPDNARSGVLVGQEGGVVAVLLAGMVGERPPPMTRGRWTAPAAWLPRRSPTSSPPRSPWTSRRRCATPPACATTTSGWARFRRATSWSVTGCARSTPSMGRA